MPWMRRVILAVLIAGFLQQSTGCMLVLLGGAAAGATATVMHREGELLSELEAEPPDIIKATERAFRDLIWTKESAQSSATDGTATARTATGKEVAVTVKRQAEAVCQISIRIGTFGDENLSLLLLDKIKFFLEHT